MSYKELFPPLAFVVSFGDAPPEMVTEASQPPERDLFDTLDFL